ncbi:bile acid:sodium symporter family protein [Nodosilinea sp. P-1105]|uniref:bile acid:sodium symporter family protein n=1 Tax=Nodosilinea sp. P-1105 TaxID=2546229 RepID=UPI00146B5831|nr:bile acid:sodium symporter family protein [Nodosilinea sp. P-1105]NMF84464.1 bile acid:sodium symporter family protein [Nodosilinea sp. P-1105]
MESSLLTAVVLPLALFLVMLGMGLGLKLDDFTRVLVYPRAVIVGLAAQLVLLPLVGFGLASLLPLSPELAVGLLIIAACPGGPTSNLVTYLARGHVALSITLTAISSLITVFTIPLVVNLAMGMFMGETMALRLPFGATVLQIAVITMLPVGLGMGLHHSYPALAIRLERRVKWVALGFLGLIIAGLLVQERANVLAFFAQVGWATLTLNVTTMACGYLIATLARLDRPSTTAITVEVGLQNGTLAIAVASAPTLLNQPNLAVPAAIYSLLMFATGGIFATWAGRGTLRV